MPDRSALLEQLDKTVDEIRGFYTSLPDPDFPVYDLWTARDVLAHLTFWHESFARNLDDLVNGRKPSPLKGRYIDLNQGGVDAIAQLPANDVLARFLTAHAIIRAGIMDPGLTLIPYKTGSRPYSPEEHLEVVHHHIQEHLRDMRKAVN